MQLGFAKLASGLTASIVTAYGNQRAACGRCDVYSPFASFRFNDVILIKANVRCV